jgi:hypothetical protein
MTKEMLLENTSKNIRVLGCTRSFSSETRTWASIAKVWANGRKTIRGMRTSLISHVAGRGWLKKNRKTTSITINKETRSATIHEMADKTFSTFLIALSIFLSSIMDLPLIKANAKNNL